MKAGTKSTWLAIGFMVCIAIVAVVIHNLIMSMRKIRIIDTRDDMDFLEWIGRLCFN